MAKKFRVKRWFKYKYLTFIRIKDNPKSIATGAALGITFDVLPTFGTGVVIAYFIAAYFKANRLAALISAVVFKIAIPFFAYINLKTGRIFLDDSVFHVRNSALHHSWLHYDWSALGISFLLGSLVNSLVIYLVTYVLIYRFVLWKRNRALRAKAKVTNL